jgi:LmbE family N-acetylglucosaminyl deacetylase
MEKVLVISVHPDDETLGCGGALLKHKKKGDSIFWLIITNADIKDGWSQELVNNRENEIVEVSKLYGFEKVINLKLSTTKLDEIPLNKIISNISMAIYETKPSTLYLNNRSDIHSDHKITFNAVMSCTKNFRYPFISKILIYETLSETEFAPALFENAFIPNVFVDITPFIDKKLEIMSVYASEVMPDNLPRSYSAIKALATYRGSRIGVNYAEAFMLLYEKA